MKSNSGKKWIMAERQLLDIVNEGIHMGTTNDVSNDSRGISCKIRL